MPLRFPSKVLCALAIVLVAAPLSARPGYPGRGQHGGDGFGRGDWRHHRSDAANREREGQVEVSRFIRRDSLGQLGHGPIAVDTVMSGVAGPGANSTYEAAAVDQLVKQGYDTLHTDGAEGQRAELQVIREVTRPAERKSGPVSGEAAVGASNRGSYMQMALNLDFTKPRGALLSTRMNARILDKVSGKVLWEGHAKIYSRDGDEDYSESAIATRLADALFSELTDGKNVTVTD